MGNFGKLTVVSPSNEELRGDEAEGTLYDTETLEGDTDGTNLTADMDASSSKLIMGTYYLTDVSVFE